MSTRKTSGGFTILEVLVASGILVAISGAMLTAGRASIRSHDLALERSQASQLLQEGFEIVRQMRDTNYLDGSGNAWDSGLTTGADLQPVWDPDNRRWQLVTGPETVQIDGTTALTFTRSIRIDPATNLTPIKPAGGAPDIDPAQLARKVTVTVTWESQGQTWSETGMTLLTDWNTGAQS